MKTSIRYVAIVSLASLQVACGGGGNSASTQMGDPRTGSYPSTISLSADPAPASLTCIDWGYYTMPLGRLSNNVWNRQAAGTSPYTQCLTAQGPLSSKQFGWSWNWPTTTSTVLAYPEVIIGWKVWEGGLSNYSPLPKKISSLTRFDWNYSVTVNTSGKHNLATDIWLTHSGVTSLGPNIPDVTTEIMIWTDGYDWNPGQTMAGTIVVNGITFEVWYTPNMQDHSGSTTHTWTYVAYRTTVPTLTVNLDVKALLSDAVNRGFISAEDYVSDVELGNEVMTGSGQTWINSMSIDVR